MPAARPAHSPVPLPDQEFAASNRSAGRASRLTPSRTMRSFQALHRIQDILPQESECRRVRETLHRLSADPRHGQAIRDDLRTGFPAPPIWMQEFLRDLLGTAHVNEAPP